MSDDLKSKSSHHNLETYLHAYIDGCGLGDDPNGPLVRTIGRETGKLTQTPLIEQVGDRAVQISYIFGHR